MRVRRAVDRPGPVAVAGPRTLAGTDVKRVGGRRRAGPVPFSRSSGAVLHGVPMPGWSGRERTTIGRKKILATATALALTVTGGMSALFLTVGATDAAATPAATTEIVEYVDAAGNPSAAAWAGVTAEPSTASAIGGNPADPATAYAASEEEHEDEDHDELEKDDDD